MCHSVPRLRRPAQDRKTYPNQGLIPALAPGPQRAAIIVARSRLIGSYLNEVPYLAGLNLHMQSMQAGSVQARVGDGQLVLRFPDRVAGWICNARALSGEPQPPAKQLDGVSGRVRLALSDVDRVFGTGAGCRRAGD
jgi:hypothetical protein